MTVALAILDAIEQVKKYGAPTSNIIMVVASKDAIKSLEELFPNGELKGCEVRIDPKLPQDTVVWYNKSILGDPDELKIKMPSMKEEG